MKICARALVTATVVAFSLAAHSAPVSGQGTWETTLKQRDIDGDGTTDAFYDTDLNLTWLRLGLSQSTSLQSATSWAEQTRFGLTGWRLPTRIDTGLPGCDFAYQGTDCGFNLGSYNELAHLFYVTLGNLALYDSSGSYRGGTQTKVWGLSNSGEFADFYDAIYWLSVEDASGRYWFFDNRVGAQIAEPWSWYPTGISLYAMAVRDGDVLASTVPEPESLVLALSALTALALARSRKPKQI